MSDQDLQFETAEPGPGAGEGPARPAPCAACHAHLTEAYYEVNGHVVCPGCHARLVAPPAGSGTGRLAKAVAMGLLAGAVGWGIYFAVLKLTGYEVGLIAIVVGFLVGKGVSLGSGGRGGWVYQLVAVGITYVAIVGTYVPMIAASIAEQGDLSGGGAWVAAGLLAIPAPFLQGFSNIIGLLIIGFALFEAWKLNARGRLEVTGPHALAAAGSGVRAGAPPGVGA